MPGDKLETTTRIPPQNIEAEAAVLGSMMLEGDAAGWASEHLLVRDFYRSSHGLIFRTMCEIYGTGQMPDEIVVAEALKQRGILEKAGGSERLHALTASVPSAANIEGYARVIKDNSLARDLISTSTSTLREAYDGKAAETLERTEQRIFEIGTRGHTTSVQKLAPVLDGQFTALEERYKNPGRIRGVATGFQAVDKMTGGLQPSDFIILAARPSVGKSAMALNIVDYVALRLGKTCLIFTLEMPCEQLVLRLMSAHCHIGYSRLMDGALRPQEWQVVADSAMGKLRNAPIFLDDTPSIAITEIRSKARRVASRHKIGLIVVDYLQLVRPPDDKSRRDSREREVAKISAALKALARELRVPVLALSQLNRAAEERVNGRASMASLRESGALEQDADVVMLLHRDHDDTGEWESEAILDIAKQRNGPTGMLPYVFLSKYMTFLPMAAQVEKRGRIA